MRILIDLESAANEQVGTSESRGRQAIDTSAADRGQASPEFERELT